MPNLVTQFSIDGSVAVNDRRRTIIGPINDNKSIGPQKSILKSIINLKGAPIIKNEEIMGQNNLTSTKNGGNMQSETAVRIVGQSKYGSLPSKDAVMDNASSDLKLSESSSAEEDEDEEG